MHATRRASIGERGVLIRGAVGERQVALAPRPHRPPIRPRPGWSPTTACRSRRARPAGRRGARRHRRAARNPRPGHRRRSLTFRRPLIDLVVDLLPPDESRTHAGPPTRIAAWSKASRCRVCRLPIGAGDGPVAVRRGSPGSLAARPAKCARRERLRIASCVAELIGQDARPGSAAGRH